MNNIEFIPYLQAIALHFPRALGMMLMVPVFKPAIVGGALIRNALILAILLPVLPVENPGFASLTPRELPDYIWLAVGEMSLGLIIGFCAAIPFWAVDMAGSFIDTLRGASIALVLNPALGQQSSPLGVLFTQVFSLFFLISGGLHILLTSLYASFSLFPPGGHFVITAELMTFLTQQWQLMYEIFLRFSMPAIVALALVDLALGFINRSAPQLNVFFLALPIKSILALLLIIAGSSYIFLLPVQESLKILPALLPLIH
ncbi:EscT/YscT/HrcT family type III secretion system export apparatus protein [Enterobacterales bacterium CwR94]|nr:EscT/YscT/HrcT family type III secretion system export apparatus protein [Enterobacterales bacterium CwR94]